MKNKKPNDNKISPKPAADVAAAPIKDIEDEVAVATKTEEIKGPKSIYEKKLADKVRRMPFGKGDRPVEEYEQRIIDVARVTRVMAGGKRMRFRACVAIGNKKGKVGLGIAKGADVTMAVTKAVNDAKKAMIDVPIVNDTIPHAIYQKFGAAKILLKPARQGKGVIAGGAVRLILELSGIKNITSKILGTNNKINVAKCTLSALANLKNVQKKKEDAKANDNKEVKPEENNK